MTSNAKDTNTPWRHPNRDPTQYEMKDLLAAATAIGVQGCFNLHTYQFGGATYHQQGGSPIGVDLSGDVAELEVVDWTNMLMEVLKDNKVITDEDIIYVDDVREILPSINRGWYYETQSKKFLYEPNLHQLEDTKGNTPTRKTLQEMGKVYNSLKPHLKFTLEYTEDFPNKRLLTLDCEIWLQGRKVMTNFFQKPTKTPYCTLANSAMPQQMIENSLTQEVVRCLTNTSLGLQVEMNNSLDELIQRMERSGHSKMITGKVLDRGLQIYTKKVKEQKEGKRGIHRRARDSLGDWRNKKLTISKSWFKTKTSKTNTSANRGQGRPTKPPST